MILDTEILVGIATLGLTLTGFSGLVAVLGKRSIGQWREGERVQFIELAVISLTVTFGAFVPILVATAFATALANDISLGILTIAHVACMVHGLRSVNRSQEAAAEYAPGVIATMVTGGATIIAASIAAIAGFLENLELFILLNLIWLLFVAVVNFVQLLTSNGFSGDN